MSDVEEQKIISDIKQTGFPSELIAGNTLEQHEWLVRYNQYFLDEDEGKGREVDIQATKHCYNPLNGETAAVWITMICSVKKCEKPWVIFTKKECPEPGWDRLLLKGNPIDNIKALKYNDISKYSTLHEYERCGNSYYSGFKGQSSQGDIFAALVTSVKACEYYLNCQKKNYFGKDALFDFSEDTLIEFIEPVVVLNGHLFEAFLDNNGELSVQRVHRVPLNFGYVSNNYRRQEGYGHYHVEIVTLDGLEEFSSKKAFWGKYMRDQIESNLKANVTK